MAKNDNGYAGKIQNSGAQMVKAPYGGGKTGTKTVKTGTDLRSGK